VFTWLYDFLVWLTTPTMRPVLGAIAAVLAAMTIDPGSWFKLGRFVRRVVQIVVVWLLLVWLLGLIPFANGQGFGWGGGSGTGGTGTNSGSGPGDITGTKPTRAGITVVAGKFPQGLPDNVLFTIEFIPLETDPNTPRDLACDVLVREPSKTTQIRSRSMSEFDGDLASVLREIKIPENVRNPVASIRPTPYPGEGTIRRIETAIRRTLPGVGLQRDENR